jgi:hypothetical protein
VPTLSVITAAHPSGSQFVEEDGEEPRLADVFAGVASYQATGSHNGPGITRNVALTRGAVGGWGAAPSAADVAMFAAVSELTAGYNDPAVNWLYRHHATQLSHQENWWRTEVSDKALVIQRVHALRNGPQSKPLAVADIGGTIPFRAGERLASGWWLQDDNA